MVKATGSSYQTCLRTMFSLTQWQKKNKSSLPFFPQKKKKQSDCSRSRGEVQRTFQGTALCGCVWVNNKQTKKKKTSAMFTKPFPIFPTTRKKEKKRSGYARLQNNTAMLCLLDPFPYPHTIKKAAWLCETLYLTTHEITWMI